MYDYFYFSEIVGSLHQRICTFLFLNYVEIASQKCCNYSHSYKQQMTEPISPHHPKLWQFSIIYVLLINWVKTVSHSFNLHSPDFQWGCTSSYVFTHHVCSLRYDLPLPFLLMAVGLFLNILYSPWDTNLLSIIWVVAIFPQCFVIFGLCLWYHLMYTSFKYLFHQICQCFLLWITGFPAYFRSSIPQEYIFFLHFGFSFLILNLTLISL